MALHIVATMFSKPHFIHCTKPIHTKIAYENYISKIVYSKLASFNSTHQNERDTKVKTFLKEKPHNHLSENLKKPWSILLDMPTLSPNTYNRNKLKIINISNFDHG